MLPSGLEFAAADLDHGAYEHEPVPEARGDAAERVGTEPLGLVPLADRDQCLDLVHDEQDALNSVPVHLLEPRLPHSRRLSWPAQHRQHVGEIHVRPFQADEIANLLGELQSLTKMVEAFFAVAEEGEVAAEHGERSHLCFAGADLPSERERLLANRQRLRIAPSHHQCPGERTQ